MNCTYVELKGKCRRYVASTAEGRAMRQLIMDEYGVKKKEVQIYPCTIPTNKVDLLHWANELLTEIDAAAPHAD